MKVIIAGSRTFKDYEFLKTSCINIISEIQYVQEIPNSELEILSGNAKGADKLGERFAREFKLKLKLFPADWKDMSWPCIVDKNDYGPYNKLAGSKRNQKMAEYVRDNGGGILIAFDVGSNGVKDMIKKANKEGLIVYKIKYE